MKRIVTTMPTEHITRALSEAAGAIQAALERGDWQRVYALARAAHKLTIAQDVALLNLMRAVHRNHD